MALSDDQKAQRLIAENRHNEMIALLTRQCELLEKILKELPSKEEKEEKEENAEN